MQCRLVHQGHSIRRFIPFRRLQTTPRGDDSHELEEQDENPNLDAPKPSITKANILLKRHVAQGDIASAREVLNQVLAVPSFVHIPSGSIPSAARAMHGFIHACIKAGNIGVARNEMIERLRATPVISPSIPFGVVSKADTIRIRRKTFQVLLDLYIYRAFAYFRARKPRSDAEGYRPRRNYLQQALDLFNAAHDSPDALITSSTLDTMITSLLRGRRIDQAVELYQRAITTHRTPPPSTQIPKYICVAIRSCLASSSATERQGALQGVVTLAWLLREGHLIPACLPITAPLPPTYTHSTDYVPRESDFPKHLIEESVHHVVELCFDLLRTFRGASGPAFVHPHSSGGHRHVIHGENTEANHEHPKCEEDRLGSAAWLQQWGRPDRNILIEPVPDKYKDMIMVPLHAYICYAIDHLVFNLPSYSVIASEHDTIGGPRLSWRTLSTLLKQIQTSFRHWKTDEMAFLVDREMSRVYTKRWAGRNRPDMLLSYHHRPPLPAFHQNISLPEEDASQVSVSSFEEVIKKEAVPRITSRSALDSWLLSNSMLSTPQKKNEKETRKAALEWSTSSEDYSTRVDRLERWKDLQQPGEGGFVDPWVLPSPAVGSLQHSKRQDGTRYQLGISNSFNDEEKPGARWKMDESYFSEIAKMWKELVDGSEEVRETREQRPHTSSPPEVKDTFTPSWTSPTPDPAPNTFTAPLTSQAAPMRTNHLTRKEHTRQDDFGRPSGPHHRRASQTHNRWHSQFGLKSPSELSSSVKQRAQTGGRTERSGHRLDTTDVEGGVTLSGYKQSEWRHQRSTRAKRQEERKKQWSGESD